MQRYFFVSALLVAACGGGQHPREQTSDGVLTITDDRGERSFRIKPDGTIVSDDGAVATLTADGELREGDLVMMRLGKDGALVLPDWPQFHATIRADGAVVQDGKVVAEFGKGGVARGELIDAAQMKLVASGDPAARRNLMAVWVGLMGSLMSLGSDHVRDGSASSSVGSSESGRGPREIKLAAVASTKGFACAGGTDGVTGQLREYDGTPLAGATVVATSPALQGSQSSITDENGCYFITDLPLGQYDITVYYVDSTATASGTLGKGLLRIDGAMVGAPSSTGDIITIESGN